VQLRRNTHFVTAFLTCWGPPEDSSVNADQIVKTATGFICEVLTDKGIYYLLVTNRHVVKNATALVNGQFLVLASGRQKSLPFTRLLLLF
jgi:hypothetical protein